MPIGKAGLPGHTILGVVICPILFFILVAGFIIVSRKGNLFCCRSSGLEEQPHQASIDYMTRISALNTNEIGNRDLTELQPRGAANDITDRGTPESYPGMSAEQKEVLHGVQSQSLHASTHSPSGPRIPPAVYIPS